MFLQSGRVVALRIIYLQRLDLVLYMDEQRTILVVQYFRYLNMQLLASRQQKVYHYYRLVM